MFVGNAWYAIAWADEVARALLSRTVINERVVLYRTLAGAPVALEDRCAHRHLPLSMGRTRPRLRTRPLKPAPAYAFDQRIAWSQVSEHAHKARRGSGCACCRKPGRFPHLVRAVEFPILPNLSDSAA
ncbi:MAG: Rieske 2Fe-2S domain-containing protein [Betaproteobacteria bacterium]|nr:Rieske 2Fe-2S domain-containing protein [Betaproteobacteria bacterium]